MSGGQGNVPGSFDLEQFEVHMAAGARQHMRGEYGERINYALSAYIIAPHRSVWSGRAARDIGAGHDRLGHDAEADAWALAALTDHDAALKAAQGREVLPQTTHGLYRERAASEIYVAVRGARRYLADPRQFREFEGSFDLLYSPVPLADMALSDMREARRVTPTTYGRFLDQYDINIARRAATVKALTGNTQDRHHAARLGLRAVLLAPFSEASWLPTAQPNLTDKERRQAKRKALIGGAASLAVSLLALPADVYTDQLARKLAARTL